jgi:hypothetical protein
MSRLDALSKQVQRMTAQTAPSVPDYILYAELSAEAGQELGYDIALWEDATLTDEARAALRLDYRRARDAEKTPERIEQERRFYAKFNAAGAKEQLLRELEHQIGQDENAAECGEMR